MRISTVILAFLGATALASVATAEPFVIDDFSSGFDAYYGDWNTGNAVTANGVLSVNSTVDGLGESYPGEYTSGIGTNNLLSITAELLPGNESSSFVFKVTDGYGLTYQYDYSATSFSSSSFTTVTRDFYSPDNIEHESNYNGETTFDMSSLGKYSIGGPYDGSGTAFDMAFSDIEVTSEPEPSSLCALGVVGTTMLLRRRVR